MLLERLALYRDRARSALTAAFREEHTPHEVAASFSIGVFVTAMPTGGLGIGLFFVLAYWLSWISKPAIFSSVAVLNPVVKPAVYVASLQVGAVVLGTGELIPGDLLATESAVVLVHQLVVGNVVVAFVLAAVGYVLALHLSRSHRRRNGTETESSLTSTVVALFDRRR